MKSDFIKKFIIPAGPILGVTLVGLLLLSAVLYYRAVKIQRFLEPALAISQPRNEFTQSINSLLLKEFGSGAVRGIRFTTGSIFVQESLMFADDNTMKKSARDILTRLNNVFMAALSNDSTRSHVGLILVSARFPLNADPDINTSMRIKMQRMSELIIEYMYNAEPGLEKNYGTFFAATARPVNASDEEPAWVEFRIIPSELVHIEVLQRLGKYAH